MSKKSRQIACFALPLGCLLAVGASAEEPEDRVNRAGGKAAEHRSERAAERANSQWQERATRGRERGSDAKDQVEQAVEAPSEAAAGGAVEGRRQRRRDRVGEDQVENAAEQTQGRVEEAAADAERQMRRRPSRAQPIEADPNPAGSLERVGGEGQSAADAASAPVAEPDPTLNRNREDPIYRSR